MKQAQLVLPFLEKYNGAAHLLYVPEGVLDAQGVLHAHIVVSTVVEAQHGEVEYNTAVFPAKPDGEPVGSRMEPFFEPARSGDVRQVLRQRLGIELVGTPAPERKTSWLGRAMGRRNPVYGPPQPMLPGLPHVWGAEDTALPHRWQEASLAELEQAVLQNHVTADEFDEMFYFLQEKDRLGLEVAADTFGVNPRLANELTEDLFYGFWDIYEKSSQEPRSNGGRHAADRKAGRSNPKHVDLIPGGRADKKQPRDFNRKQLVAGRKVEREHTRNRTLAQEIAMDHLTEDPRYYRKLAKMERSNGAEPSMRSLGKVIRKVLASAQAWEVIDKDPDLSRSTSFVAGGCWTLAGAIHALIPGSRIVVLEGSMGGHRGPQHVAVQAVSERGEPLILDGDGASSLPVFLKRWEQLERVGRPVLRDYTTSDTDALIKAGVVYSVDAETKLRRLLMAAFEDEAERLARDLSRTEKR